VLLPPRERVPVPFLVSGPPPAPNVIVELVKVVVPLVTLKTPEPFVIEGPENVLFPDNV
jgi:hypothetical protein